MVTNISSKDVRARKDNEVDLKKWPTMLGPIYKSKKQYQKPLTDRAARPRSQ